METTQAISVLTTAARIGQAKGAYTIEEASIINEAIKAFTPAPATTVTPEVVKEDSIPTPAEFMPEDNYEQGGPIDK